MLVLAPPHPSPEAHTIVARFPARADTVAGIPDAIGSLTALTVLNLLSNQLTEIPVAIGSLTALTELVLGYNELTGTIPDSLWNLKSLVNL